MNLVEEFKKGQRGGNRGLNMGIDKITKSINGIQKGRIYCLSAPPKVGKTTFVDFSFLIQPYLSTLNTKNNIEWLYFSFEIDRVSKEFDFATYFLYKDYGIRYIKLKENINLTIRNVKLKEIEVSPDYLRGRILDDNNEVIKIEPRIEKALAEIYKNRIIPLFGRYNEKGIQIKKGLITFVSKKNTPNNLEKILQNFARNRGRVVMQDNKITGYKPNDPNKYVIVITDHLRKIEIENKSSLKQSVDKFTDISVEFRNIFNFTFVHIIHTNRNLSDISRMRFNKDELHPTSEDAKDTGNTAEDCDYYFTMFNPNDDKYNLNTHFGLKIRDDDREILYPNLRTLHLVESRHCFYPQHFSILMEAHIKNFKSFI